jgi:hypothetical protein
MELAGLEPATSWVRFALKDADLQRVSEEAASPEVAAIHANYRRLSPFQALLAISARTIRESGLDRACCHAGAEVRAGT